MRHPHKNRTTPILIALLAFMTVPSTSLGQDTTGAEWSITVDDFVDWLCSWDTTQEIGEEVTRPIFEERIQHENVAIRAFAIHCLAYYGDEGSMELLNAVAEDDTLIPAWGDEDVTIADEVESVMDEIQTRLAQATEPVGMGAEELEVYLDDLWTTIYQSTPPGDYMVFWRSAETPALPTSWSPDTGYQMVRYVYATGFSDGLTDAEVVSQPYARITWAWEGEPLYFVEVSGESLQELGIQGFWPINSEAALTDEWRIEAEGILQGGLTPGMPLDGELDPLRGYYCRWMDYHAVIADGVSTTHQEFFDWLQCNVN